MKKEETAKQRLVSLVSPAENEERFFRAAILPPGYINYAREEEKRRETSAPFSFTLLRPGFIRTPLTFHFLTGDPDSHSRKNNAADLFIIPSPSVRSLACFTRNNVNSRALFPSLRSFIRLFPNTRRGRDFTSFRRTRNFVFPRELMSSSPPPQRTVIIISRVCCKIKKVNGYTRESRVFIKLISLRLRVKEKRTFSLSLSLLSVSPFLSPSLAATSNVRPKRGSRAGRNGRNGKSVLLQLLIITSRAMGWAIGSSTSSRANSRLFHSSCRAHARVARRDNARPMICVGH